jgi:hypothetical protein
MMAIIKENEMFAIISILFFELKNNFIGKK